jgi:acetylornithine deacetylase/succinyl-diaminopimelate desuccinylase-like protein
MDSINYTQMVGTVKHSIPVQDIFSFCDSIGRQLIKDWKKLAKIFSPSKNERIRAEYITKRFNEIGLDEVEIDQHGNAVGSIEGKQPGPTIVFFGTMDDLATVAEMVKQWEGPIQERDGKLIGPGTNSSATCTTILGLAYLFTQTNLNLRGRIYLVGLVQEETGLTGIKGFLEDRPNEIDYIIDIMAGIGRISYGALGINWFKVHFTGPKAHTLRGDGPNVTKGVAKAVNIIWELTRPSEPESKKVFLNISMLGAGKVFNHRHNDGWFSVDLRSSDNYNLNSFKSEIIKIVEKVAEDEELGCWIEEVSGSPAGIIPGSRNSPLVRIAEEATKSLGYDVMVSSRGSSNMNVGINQNILSISTGGSRGGQRNTPDEYANIEPVLTGIKLNFLIGYILSTHIR